MEKYFVILGGNMLLQGVHDKLKEFGYKVIVVDWNEKPGFKGDLHLQIDVKDSDRVIEALKKTNYKIDGCESKRMVWKQSYARKVLAGSYKRRNEKLLGEGRLVQ